MTGESMREPTGRPIPGAAGPVRDLSPGARQALRVGVIGAGRLGSALVAGLAHAGYAGVAVAARRAERGDALAREAPGVSAAGADGLVRSCDLVFLAVPDDALAGVAAAHEWWRGQAVVHTSGATGLDVLAPAAERGALAGCFHPLQTFPAGEPPAEGARRLYGVTAGVEGREPLGGLLEAVARDLGATPVRLEGVDRALYHAAAVLASNAVVALAAASQRAWALAGLPPGAAREALGPLLLAAASNAAALPPERALTGPVARGDAETVEHHLRALEREPELRELYRRLALELLRLDLGHAAEVRERLRALLGDASHA